jgi:tetratricopeptide (TPR) repeat protein
VRALYLLADTETVLGEKNKAISLYKKLCEINMTDPVAPYKLGILYFEMGQLDTVETLAGELIEKFPTNSYGYRLKGIALYRKRDFHEAITVLQNANKLQPSIVGHYFLGLSLYSNGELESAMNQFRQILDRTPSFYQARLLIGVIHLQQKRVDDAISELNKLLDADEKNAQAHNILGSAYMAKGMFEEGMKELDIATKIDPRLVDAYLKKGMIFLSQGKNTEVEVDLTTAIRIAPELQNTRLILASFYQQQNNHNKAFTTLKEGLVGKKTDEILYCGMAKILFSNKKTAEAIHYINKAKEINPEAVAPYFILAAYYASSRDIDKAMKEYSDVLKKEPGNVKGMLRIASLLESVGRENEAAEMYLKAKETHDPSAYLALSRFYEKKGDSEKALSILVDADRYVSCSADLLEQRVQLHLKNGQHTVALKTCDDLEAVSTGRAISKRVAVYVAMKKWPEAIKEARRAINLKPDSSYGYMLLAFVYQKQNNSGLAIETLKKGVQRDRNNLQTALSLAVLYAKSGNHSMSMKTCDDILKRRPNYAPAYFTQGTFLEAKGNKKEAIKKYRAALAQSSNYAAPLNNIAYLYLDGYGSKEEALRLAESAMALEPENPGIMDTLGYALLKNSRPREARKNLEKAVTIMPEDPTVNYHLALVHQASGDKKQAVERLKIALRSENFAGIQQARNLLTELN